VQHLLWFDVLPNPGPSHLYLEWWHEHGRRFLLLELLFDNPRAVAILVEVMQRGLGQVPDMDQVADVPDRRRIERKRHVGKLLSQREWRWLHDAIDTLEGRSRGRRGATGRGRQGGRGIGRRRARCGGRGRDDDENGGDNNGDGDDDGEDDDGGDGNDDSGDGGGRRGHDGEDARGMGSGYEGGEDMMVEMLMDWVVGMEEVAGALMANMMEGWVGFMKEVRAVQVVSEMLV